MIPDLANALLSLILVGFAILDVAALDAHRLLLAAIGIALVVLGAVANRLDYLKWPGIVTAISGLIVLLLAVSGIGSISLQSTFWVALWAGVASGITSLWSALYRGPQEDRAAA